MMYVLIFVIFVILLIITLLIMVPLNVKCSFNSEKLADFKLSLSWLRALIKGMIKIDGNNVIFTLYLYNKKILSKNLTANKSKDTNNFKLIKYVKFLDVRLQTSYGFEDPAITGMVCGAINIISEYIDSNDSENNPDFSTDYDYFNFDVAVKVNVLVSLFNILKSKKPGLVMQGLHVSK